MQRLPSPAHTDSRNDLCREQASSCHLVSRDHSSDPEQERDLGAGAQASAGGLLQHGLADQAQASSGDERKGRQASVGGTPPDR